MLSEKSIYICTENWKVRDHLSFKTRYEGCHFVASTLDVAKKKLKDWLETEKIVYENDPFKKCWVDIDYSEYDDNEFIFFVAELYVRYDLDHSENKTFIISKVDYYDE